MSLPGFSLPFVWCVRKRLVASLSLTVTGRLADGKNADGRYVDAILPMDILPMVQTYSFSPTDILPMGRTISRP